MPARFTRRRRAVVANQTSARCHTHVTKRRWCPSRGTMAAVTRSNGRNMPARFCRCPHAVTDTVTTCTIPWRPLEHSLDMAGLARSRGMGACKVKPSFDMVEFCGARPSCLRQCKMRHSQQWQYEHHRDPTRRTQGMKHVLYPHFISVVIHLAAPIKFVCDTL